MRMLVLNRTGFLAALAEATNRYKAVCGKNEDRDKARQFALERGISSDRLPSVTKCQIEEAIMYFGGKQGWTDILSGGDFFLLRAREEAAWDRYQELLAVEPKDAED